MWRFVGEKCAFDWKNYTEKDEIGCAPVNRCRVCRLDRVFFFFFLNFSPLLQSTPKSVNSVSESQVWIYYLPWKHEILLAEYRVYELCWFCLKLNFRSMYFGAQRLYTQTHSDRFIINGHRMRMIVWKRKLCRMLYTRCHTIEWTWSFSWNGEVITFTPCAARES